MNAISKKIKIIFYITLLVIFLIAPLVIDVNYYISVLVTCLAFACFGIAWNIIGGYGAQVAWCHAAFIAVGSYTSLILYNGFGISPFLTMPIGMLISLALATLIGYGTLRLRGAYFSIATIAFAECVRVLLLYLKPLTGGASGISVTFTGNNFFHLTFSNDKPFYYILLVMLCIVLFIAFRFEKSKTGYYLKAIKGDEDAALSLGIETSKIKLKAFQISALITSAVGTVFGFFLTYVEPNSIAGLSMSVKIGIVAIVGGLGTLWGPVLGAFLLILLIEVAGALLGQFGSGQLLYGLVLVIVVIFKPNGVITFFKRNTDTRLPGRRLFLKKKKEMEAKK